MYKSNVKCQFAYSNGTVITENLFGFQLLSDDITVTQDSVVMGFDCGAPPEPIVSKLNSNGKNNSMYLCVVAYHTL